MDCDLGKEPYQYYDPSDECSISPVAYLGEVRLGVFVDAFEKKPTELTQLSFSFVSAYIHTESVQ